MCPWGLNNRPYLLIPVLSLHWIEYKCKATIKYVISVQKMCFYTFTITLTQSLLLAHWSIFSSGPNCLKRMFWLMKFYILFCSQINAHYNSLHIFLILFCYLLLDGKELSFIFQQLNWLNCLKKQFLSSFIWIDWLTTAETVQGRVSVGHSAMMGVRLRHPSALCSCGLLPESF